MKAKNPAGNAVKGITVFRTYAEAILNPAYTPEEQAKLWEAVFRYAFYDEEIELTGTAASLFSVIMPVLANSKQQALNAMHRHKANPKPDESRTQAKCEPEKAERETTPSLILTPTPTPTPASTPVSAPAPVREPDSAEDVLDIARKCGVNWNSRQAEVYFLNRRRQNWITANGQRITDIAADIRYWDLKEQHRHFERGEPPVPDKETEAILRAREMEAFI